MKPSIPTRDALKAHQAGLPRAGTIVPIDSATEPIMPIHDAMKPIMPMHGPGAINQADARRAAARSAKSSLL